LDEQTGKTVPVGYVNAFADDVAKCKEAEMDAHLPKPFKADQLIASIVACDNRT